MERNIRDVRDIFGRSGGESKPEQELRSYEYSPRSRRRQEAMENYDPRVTSRQHHIPENRTSNSNKKNSRHRATQPVEDSMESVRHSKKVDDHQKHSSKKAEDKKKDAVYYANNRTLTERDIRHLERHLSMKKTIRKQISRNLHQAFVDDPEMMLNDVIPPVAATKTAGKMAPDRTFTLTRAKVSKSEQNVLDLLKDNEPESGHCKYLLKDNEPDSGHCSADNPNSSDDDMNEMKQRRVAKPADKTPSAHKAVHDIRGKPEDRSKPDQSYKDDGKFSFWKMFSVKNRGKR